MAGSTNVSIRMDADLKAQADALFGEMGLNMSTAVNIFIRQAVREGRIPFDISVKRPNRDTPAAAEAEQSVKEPSEKNITDMDTLFEELRR